MSGDFQSSPFVEFVGTLTGHKAPVSSMAWSPNGDWLASCSVDGTLNLWSALRAKNRPRFSRRRTGAPSPLTSVAWSANGRYVAAGSTAGWLDIWEGNEFVPVDHPDDGARTAIRCVAWAGERNRGELRLAFGGDDRIVHFRNYTDWRRPDVEQGIGHGFVIVSLAWSPDGNTLVTGTDGGTIGVWQPSGHDNQLRQVLDWHGIHAHEDAVTALAWSATTDVLASVARDGRLHLWRVGERLLLDTLTVDEELFDVSFALEGALLVVHGRDHIRFVRTRPRLQEICRYELTAVPDSTTSWIAFDGASRLAVVDPEDGATIGVWRLDVEGILKQSDVTERPYAAVNVPVLGETGSGRTNLSLVLTGGTFDPKRAPHGFSVHMLRVPARDAANEPADIREIAFWDLPSRVDHLLVQQIHAGDGAVAVMVLDPEPGTEVAAPVNLERWRHTLRRWRDLLRHQRPLSIVVIPKCDTLRTPPTARDSVALARALGFAVVFVSAKSGLGIGELRAAILDAVNWTEARSFPSVETFAFVRAHVQALRGEQRYLTSTRDLYEGFKRAHRFLADRLPDEPTFTAAVRLLEVIGEAQYFGSSDDVLVTPSYYHVYAAALIAGAQKDEDGMGRLALREAEIGRGRHINLEESDRLADAKQESKLLKLTIDDLVDVKGVAQEVSTDGVSYLVFPVSLMRVRDPAEPTPPAAACCHFEGAIDHIYSSLIVRLLGLKRHYPDRALWKNEARFVPASGGYCGLALNPSDSGDEADLTIYFDTKTGAVEQAQFMGLVRDHLASSAQSMSSDLDEDFIAAHVPAKAGARVEVYLSWKSDRAESVTAQNVAAIASELEARGIRVLGGSAMRPGETHQERLALLERSRVAAFLMAGALSKGQELDLYRLEPTGCRIIPVVLPNARKNFEIPVLLRRWGSIDFRGKFLDVTPFERAIISLFEAGPLPRAADAPAHAFLSYCREDFDLVNGLRQTLESAGHPVWLDQEDGRLLPGSDWEREIKRAIRGSYAFILCLSDRWVASSRSGIYPEVIEAIAMQRNMHPNCIFIIPVRLSNCEPPDIQIDALKSLNALQRFDYFGPNPHVGGLVNALDRARREARPEKAGGDVSSALL